MIGETFSHYRIIEQLGEGGMGVVYLGEDINLGRPVAMKFLTSTAPEYRARFLREAQAVSLLSHQNIAAVFDYGETPQGQPYIVMELIKGEPLSEKLRGGSLPVQEAARIVCSIAEALAEAHFQGIVHRDIKPSNVIVNERGQVKIVDFGLVKQIYEDATEDTNNKRALPIGARTRSDVIVGTPLYLSPEQATGKTVDGRSDLFALGAVLYECLTGESAFSGGSVIEIGAQVIHVTPLVPSQLNQHVPPALDRITMKAMEKKVEDRYQTAEELLEDLRALQPSLQAERYYTRNRTTKSLKVQRTNSASALTTLAETFREPRLSWRTVLIGLFVVGSAIVAISIWLKPTPYEPSAAALEFNNKGMEYLRDGAFLQASKALEQAIANDPRFAMAHARLAEAWFELDYADKAKDEILIARSLVTNRSPLIRNEAVYLEAITSTIARDFAGAIRSYLELQTLASDQPQVYVDLGRAYEKSDEIKKAIESYVTANNRAPQYPTAFLRVGILYARQMDQTNAIAAFATADTLYQASGNYEGKAEVEFQRGFLFDQTGQFDKAREHLQLALNLARTTGNDYQQVKTLLKLGDLEIEKGELSNGRQIMLEALNLSQAKGIDNLTTRGLIDVGNTFLAEANYAEAEKYFKQSFDLARRHKDTRNAARAALVLGSLAERLGNSNEATRYVELALPFYKEGGYRKETMQAFHLLARASDKRGDHQEALQSLAQVLDLSKQLGESSTEGLAHEDIGLILMKQGEYLEALRHFEENTQISRKAGGAKNEGLSLTDRGNVLWRLGLYDEARARFAEAHPIIEKLSTAKNLVAWYHLSKARMALSERQFGEAQRASKEALAVAAGQVKIVAIAATSTLGLARALSGGLGEGVGNCQEAVEIARTTGDPYLLAEALLALAEAQIESKDSPGALKNSIEARDLFARFGKPDSEWLTCLITARASRTGGDVTKAREYSYKAEQLLFGLEQKWGKENYSRYLNRKDVQFSRQQLSNLIAEKT
jgi:serine/threonine protein kinase/Tfp pilus assembly protein PilF